MKANDVMYVFCVKKNDLDRSILCSVNVDYYAEAADCMDLLLCRDANKNTQSILFLNISTDTIKPTFINIYVIINMWSFILQNVYKDLGQKYQ